MNQSNRTITGRIVYGFVMLLTLIWSGQTVAQTVGSAPPGSVVTSAYAPLPENSAISVDFREDSEQNARLLPVIEEELRERGHTVSADAPLVLKISLVIQSGTQPEERFSVSGQGDRRGVSNARVAVKVDRNPKNQKDKTRYRLEADLIAQETQPIWKGAANIAVSDGRDRKEVSELLVRTLMAELGTTVRNKAIVD